MTLEELAQTGNFEHHARVCDAGSPRELVSPSLRTVVSAPGSVPATGARRILDGGHQKVDRTGVGAKTFERRDGQLEGRRQRERAVNDELLEDVRRPLRTSAVQSR